MSLFNLPLQIQRRGNFFSDTGFENDRRYFESAATDLMKEFEMGRMEDSFRSYRRLRDRQLSGTDRAAKFAEEDENYKIVMDVEGFGDADLQVKVLGPTSICIEGTQEVKTGGTESKKFFRRRFSLPNTALVEDACSSLSSDNVLTVKIPKKITEIKDSSSANTQLTQQVDNLEEEIEKSFRDLKSSTSINVDTNQRSTNLPIVTKSSFFNDSFFENERSDFQKSIEDILNKRTSRMGSLSDVTLKAREAKQGDVQAVSVSDDEKLHKIVLDVHGFSEGDLKVNAVSDTELCVEGCNQTTTKYTNCCSSFKRNFTIPREVNIRESTSALSSEGILTILIPKNKSIPPNFEIPVLTDTSNKNTNTVENVIPIDLSSTSRQEQVNEQIVHSKIFGEDKKQKTSVTSKGEQIVPINMEGQQTEITTQKEQRTTEQFVPVTVEGHLTSEQSTQVSKSCHRDSTHDRLVPIAFKGSFYNDSIFEDTRKNFDREAQEALNTFKGTTQLQTNQSNQSNQTNQSNLLQKSSSTISDDASSYKVVLDVFGYEEHELQIKVCGCNEICVEGLSEKSSGGTKTKKSFCRSFQLPSYVDLERTSTALSSEGILTITIPKKNQMILKTENVIPITSQLEKSKEEKTTLVVDATGAVKDQKIEQKYSFQPSTFDSSSLESSASTTTAKIQEVPVSKETSVGTSHHLDSQTIVPISTNDTDMMRLPIMSKGNFFDDSFFQDSRPMFESSLKNTMSRFNRATSFVDDLGFYKSLRQRGITDGGNQESSVTEESQFTKIVIDVGGFDEKSLSIKFDGKNEITVEGDQEEQSGNSICRKKFRRSFVLPCGINPDTVTSALSIDGVLSINIPKEAPQPMIK